MQSDEREGRDCVVRGYETVLKAYCSKRVWMKFSRKAIKERVIMLALWLLIGKHEVG